MGKLEPRVRDAALPALLPGAARAPSPAAPPRLVLLALGTLAITTAAWIDPLVGEALAGIHALLIAALFLLGAALLLAAATRATPWRPAPRPSRRYRLAASGVLAAVSLYAIVTIALALGFALFSAATPQLYDSDAAAFNQFNAELVLRGRNPYTADTTFWDAIRRFPDAGATPLRAGRYALSVYGPSLRQLVRDVQAELANPALRGPEFAPASLHSYPALAFLVYVPGVWLGLPTTLATSVLFTLLFLLAAGWGAPRGARLWVGALLLANTLFVFWTLRGSFEVVALLPALLAWRLLDHRWLSALFLGLACAVKQLVWPLAAFYTIIVWRRSGPREALGRLGIAALAFLAPNLPFLLANPSAWASSQLLPMSLPIFSSGIGLVGLARWGLLPLFPPTVYTALELLAFAGLLVWFARARVMPRAELALVVGLLPYFLAWHSAFPYLIAIPTLAIYAALEPLRRDLAGHLETATATDDTSTAQPALAPV